jgi:hypothetical protein
MLLEHWMPDHGGIRKCRMHRRRTAAGEIIFTGRNGSVCFTLTPVRNAPPGGPAYMLVEFESPHHQDYASKGDAS